MRTSFLAVVTVVAATTIGCGSGGGDDDDDDDDDLVDGGGNPAAPVLIPGGGVGSGAIAGVLHVHIIDDTSGAALAGADVIVEREAADRLTGTTDGDGLVSFTDAALAGPVAITARADGHAPATWIGVDGANSTLGLSPAGPPASARVTGTIAGWNDLPAPSFGHYTLGVVLSTFTPDLSAPENRIPQPVDGNDTPTNLCLRSLISNSCAFEMNARIGPQRLYAIIVDGDDHGSATDTSDDTYTLIGYAASEPMTLSAGQQLANQTLARVGVGALVAVDAAFPAAPSGLPDIAGFPILDLGGPGWMVFALPGLTPARTSAQVLAPTGAFAGTYLVAALASPAGAAASPFTLALAHGVAAGATAQLPAWLPPPTVTSAAAPYALDVPADADVYFATLGPAGGPAAWTVMILDGTKTFSLPALEPDPLAGVGLELSVSVADVATFSPRAFDVPSLRASLSRVSGAVAPAPQ